MQTVEYQLTPRIIEYKDKPEGEFRSAEAIREALKQFPGIPVVIVKDFDSLPDTATDHLDGSINIGFVAEVAYQDPKLKLQLELMRPEVTITDVRVSWKCNIEPQAGTWEGQPYSEIQVNLTPRAVMVTKARLDQQASQ